MTAPSFTVPVTVVSRVVTGQDVYGNDVYSPSSSTVQGVYAPADANGTGSNEITGAQDTVLIGAAVFLPGTVNPSAVDAVEILGVQFEINGEPTRWDLQPHPWSGWIPSLPVVIPLKRVTGQ